MSNLSQGLSDVAAWTFCADCEERHAPDYDCKTYGPVCHDCGHHGDRRFRYSSRYGGLRDVLAPSLTPDHIECSVCEGADIALGVVDV